MKLMITAASLLASLAMGAMAATVDSMLVAVDRPFDDYVPVIPRRKYPKSESFPTYNVVNKTELGWAMHCLAEWCDDNNNFIDGETGKVRCYTESKHPGVGATAFICAPEGRARCSRNQIVEAWNELEDQSNSETGWLWKRSGHNMLLAFGFDRLCEGRTCGGFYDPMVAACDGYTEILQVSPLQFSKRVHAGNLYDDKYKGVTWVDTPTPAPAAKKIAYPTATPAAKPDRLKSGSRVPQVF
ncbi:hypothetical protein B0T25DRAFT_571325 [Lasiosphaeria hispida]|uniref:Secreted protein n=1 Tax=Lasiosphaeria hispida TaxID=260671 RepID=A0AAJ0MAD6_9PEZI|nr:hypothetical protein B0T25DRAFT_571325 [Lasiosphaeria hispida]